jgi:hypothetical protein
MASQIAGNLSRRNTYGIKVDRAAAVLPATGNQTLFTITGRIILTTFIAEVTTVMSATATNLKWTLVPTSGITAVDLTANVAVTSLAVGNEVALTTLGAAASTGGIITQNNELVLVPGILRATTDATNTGAVKYSLLYFPLDDGASVVAN